MTSAVCIIHLCICTYMVSLFLTNHLTGGPPVPLIVRVLPITHSRSIHSGTMLHASPFNAQVASLPSGLLGSPEASMLSKRVWPVGSRGLPRCGLPRQARPSESDCHHLIARGGQARLLRPAVQSRVVDLSRVETPTGAAPAEDVELATHRCGGVRPPSVAHASQLRPCVGLRVVDVG